MWWLSHVGEIQAQFLNLFEVFFLNTCQGGTFRAHWQEITKNMIYEI